ncbi:MAG: BolA/IbaG family iron-sulfur metabolism protein [Gammaproteobacteria bacterium]|nr:BolA/IbaG family iron-sulfur metabolism protein [Gammaproteobacteria bacterium]
MQAEDIKRLIEAGLPDCQAQVKGDDGVHFEAVIVSGAFEGKGMLAQHKMVYATLGDLMHSAIHALSMRTYTPQEWEKIPPQ